MMILGALVRKDAPLDAARETMLSTIEEIHQKPITTEELERARTSLLTDIDLTLNSSDRVGLGLSEFIGMGDWRLFFIHRDNLKKARLQDVQRVADSYLRPSNRTVAVFVPTDKPERAEIPPAPDLASIVKDYKGGAEVASGEAFDPSTANINARTRSVDLP